MRSELFIHADRWGRATRLEWFGPTWKLIEVNPELILEFPLPYPVRKVDERLAWATVVYARCDGWHVFSWLYWWTLARAENGWVALLRALYHAATRTGRFSRPDYGEVMSLRGLWRGFRGR